MITEFIKHLSSIKGYSPATASAYRKDLCQFVDYIRENYPQATWSTITRSMVETFIMHLVSIGEKPTTTNRKLSAISAIYRYFYYHVSEIENPAQYVSRRKIADRLPNTIDPTQLKAAYAQATGTTRVMLGLLITTGMRIGELLAIRWEDINLTEETIIIHGKGNKDRKVRVPSAQLEEIRYAYDQQTPTDTLFHTSQYETRSMIYATLAPYCKAKQLSPHAIRHTYATEMAKAGANAPTIAHQLGHNNIKTTQHYIDNNKCAIGTQIEYIKLK